MQVITAIYLNCRPDLRDEWLSGNEVDDLAEAQVTVGLRNTFLNLTHGAARDKNTRLDILSNSVSFISSVEPLTAMTRYAQTTINGMDRSVTNLRRRIIIGR